MRYELKPISQENWRTAASLEVSPHQKGLIADNSISLLEAAYDTERKWTPIGLYVDNKMVGFAMIGIENQQEHSIWFDRFMIDHYQQRQGYGHALFRSVLTYLKERYKQVSTVYLTVQEENKKAIPFYESYGFTHADNQKTANGTQIMCYTIEREE